MTDPTSRTFELSDRKRALLEARRRAAGRAGGGAPPLVPRGEDGPAPLSFAQQRLWFLTQLAPDSPFYNVPTLVQLHGPLDGAALTASLAAIWARHDALRTLFVANAGDPRQVVQPDLPLPLRVIDLRDDSTPAVTAQRVIEIEIRRPFDLTQGPLMRALLLRLADDEHQLLLNFHHVVVDGWSLGILWRELAASYDAAVTGRPIALPPLPIQYPDFAVWQRAWLQGATREGHLAYWRARLRDLPAQLDLPADHARPAHPSFAGQTMFFSVPANVAAGVQQLARQEGATLFMTTLAMFKVLLYRYSRQGDIVVGTPSANRTQPELAGLIGFFVNTLILRTALTGVCSFREVLARVRETILEATAHQELPFEQVVEAVQPDRSSTATPLFQVLFSLEEAAGTEIALAELHHRFLDLDTGTAKVDLSLTLQEQAGGLHGAVEYSTDLFEPATIARLVGHFQTLLAAIVATPDVPVGQLPLLTAMEREQLLEAGQPPREPQLAVPTVPARFAAQVARAPQAPALTHGSQLLTYAELNAQANRLAHYLRAHGVGPETRVAVYLDRSPALVIAMLAILKAGAAYVPLDPAYPAERLSFILADTRPVLLLTHTHLCERLPPASCLLLYFDLAATLWADRPATDLPALSSGNSLAYIMYTSGSTGRPKGIAIPHQGIVRLIDQPNFAALGPDEVVLHLAPAAFDAATFEIWGSLLNGARLVLCPIPQPTLAEIATILAEYQVTTLWLTAGLFHQMVEHHPQALAGVRQVLAGGDVLSPSHVRQFLPRLGTGLLINGYGPTENTTFTCCYPMPATTRIEDTVPLGRPIRHTTVYVLDSAGQPVPMGIPGELYTGGAGLARGYWQQPALTAAAFVPDPFGGSPGARLYRTGDLARWRADGTVEFLGRRDQQVKIRGFRIEIGEIEVVLAQHPAVQAGVVTTHRDPDGGWQLVAYLVPRAGESLAADLIRDYAQERLPAYMVPSTFLVLAALPLTANGKVDRRALPAPQIAASTLAAQAPRTPLEATLAAIWATALGRPQVGIEDNFFALGGHSLLATRVIARIQTALGVSLPLRSLFEAPTVARLAARLTTLPGVLAGTLPPLRAVERPSTLPLSAAQERLWFLTQVAPQSAFYNIPYTVRYRQSLVLAALEASLNQIVARHEVLRTAFPRIADQPRQVILPTLTVLLKVIDLTDLAPAERTAALTEQIAVQAQQPFDLAAPPLFRATLWRVSDDEVVLQLTLHHIIADGWSLQILAQELAVCYNAYIAGRPADLPSLPIQYGDYTLWQQGWLHSPALEAQIGYWRQQLATLPEAMPLPTDYPRPTIQSFRGALHTYTIPTVLVEELRTLSNAEDATLFVTLFAAFAVLLHRTSGQTDLVISTPVAGRNTASLESLIGFFVNTLVLRLDLGGNPSFRTVLRAARTMVLDALAHQDVSFSKLVEVLQPNRKAGQAPIASISFALQNEPMPVPVLNGGAGQFLEVPTWTAKADLNVALEEGPDGLAVSIEYNTDVFDDTTPWLLGSHYQILLEGMAATPDRPILELSLLAAVERRLVLDTWNRSARRAAPTLLTPQLIEAQARQRPAARAVTGPDETLTYETLNRRANQLAYRLRVLGVGPEVPVGVLQERTSAMIVSLLAVLKAGGVYIPLDPAHPPGRLAYMLADAGAPLLLTQASLTGRVADYAGQVLVIDQLLSGDAPSADLPPLVDPANLAYIIYTSGSTGRPKGVGITHHSLANMIFWHNHDFALTPDSRTTHLVGLGFDVTVEETWPPLAGGAGLYLVPDHLRLDPGRLRDWFIAQGITQAILPTPLAEQFMQVGEPAVTSLRWLLVIGDRLHRAPAPGQPYQLVNNYGPTESTVVATTRVVSPTMVGTPTIGRPIDNTCIYILDPRGQLVPIGLPGEIYIGGVGLARNYVGRPDLTAERFVPNPFSEIPGARLYRTGDLARWLAGGDIDFLGRRDHQVKIRGYRIELGEIESLLRRAPAVREAVVMAREDWPGQQQIVAYVVSQPDQAVDSAALQALLEAELPGYMIPSDIILLAAFPLTANGKINRIALPAPVRAAPEPEAIPSGPATAIQQTLLTIWQTTLQRPQVGLRDNFFDLGGHSLHLIQVQTQIREQIGRDLPIVDLFVHPTVQALAAHLGGGIPAADPAAAIGRPAGRRAGLLQQQRRRRQDHRAQPGEEGAAPG